MYTCVCGVSVCASCPHHPPPPPHPHSAQLWRLVKLAGARPHSSQSVAIGNSPANIAPGASACGSEISPMKSARECAAHGSVRSKTQPLTRSARIETHNRAARVDMRRERTKSPILRSVGQGMLRDAPHRTHPPTQSQPLMTQHTKPQHRSSGRHAHGNTAHTQSYGGCCCSLPVVKSMVGARWNGCGFSALLALGVGGFFGFAACFLTPPPPRAPPLPPPPPPLVPCAPVRADDFAMLSSRIRRRNGISWMCPYGDALIVRWGGRVTEVP